VIVTADTNLFVYAVDERDPEKLAGALAVTEALRERQWPIGLQVCGEFYRASTRRLKRSPWEAAQGARNLMVSFGVFPATMRSTERALAEAASGRFSFWDANLLSAAEEAGCTHLISEDMQDGARLGRVEVVRAFDTAGVSSRARELLQL
jgi:predicted nucleic acid-binding protein